MGSVARPTRIARTEERRDRLARVFHHLRVNPDPVIRRLAENKNFVPGRGSMFPDLVFVGEAPGRNENDMRKPFIGASGKFLDDLLESVGLDRASVYITNSVKWWPTEFVGKKMETRDPTLQEKSLCRSTLFMEFRILGFPPVVALGKHAAGVLAKNTMHKRAEWYSYEPRPANSYERRIPGFPFISLYHPAAGLYRQSLKPQIFEEFQKVMETPYAA